MFLGNAHPAFLTGPINNRCAVTQHGRRRIITFEFGRHIDTYFCNLEGHGSLNPLKLELKNSGFRRNYYTGCPKKASVIDFSDFLD